LRAQLAAHRLAEQRLQELVGRRGEGPVTAAMHELLAYSERVVRAAISGLPDGRCEAEDVLESPQGDLVIRASVTIAGDEIAIDFAGTAPQYEGNLNCPLAVTRSAAYFVVRCLTAPDLPASGGAFAPVTVTAPEGCVVNARPPAAVAAGNVETSQCIVDALYGALGILAASQGTMNNLTFGDARLQYYETICGGAGAGPDFDGCDAVHTHMTNSRLTDPEILEGEFPVLVREFAIRHGSGGAGRFHGGDGTLRRLEFRSAFSGALLANHRRIAPFGLAGGESGARGEAHIRRADGRRETLGATASFEVAAGDELTILTPGGGGFGSAD
ncbi:MAG TPA: hydantoinase B/oxoprolinase family protein, partial [Steroidobacteraceae bacterium]|nr:hydantoinase B/oxoprolinase family protein [Steroidobacteraceae bacterium]